jgi:hypothetical protein
MESEQKTQLELLKVRIPFDQDIFGTVGDYEQVLKNLLDDSKHIALSIRYPFDDYTSIDLPKRYFNWQLRCSVEIYQGIGKENIKSYAENGIQWTRDAGNISNDLLDEIMPTVGVIKEEVENDI